MEKFRPAATFVRPFAWASLIAQILIVVTGGAVRLTASGLGCPTWPECQPGSLTTVPELGIHGIIEFGNRLLTFVLVFISLATFIAVMRLAKTDRRGMVWTSLALGFGIIAQAVIGGISVLTGLNSWIVGLHFIVSAVLIVIATILLWYSYGAKSFEVSDAARRLTAALFPLGMLTVVVGVIVTGAGPHAGDIKTPRNGLDIELMAHFHSYPGYLTLAVVLLQIYLLAKSNASIRTSFWLLATISAQAVIGVIQTRTGLPIELVALHMLGASVLASLLCWQQLQRGIWFKDK